MRERLGRFGMLVGVLVAICLVAFLLAQVAEWSGLRDKWATKRAQAEAARLEAAAARERQLPLIVASLADTVAASVYAAADRVALVALVVYVLWDRRERGRDVR